MFVLLPVVPAVVAATALVQCGKARESQKPSDKGRLSSKKSLPSRSGPRLSKSGPASRSNLRTALSKRSNSSKMPSSTKSSKGSKEKSALKSKLTKQPDESTKTATEGASDKLGKDKEKTDKEQDKSKKEKQKDKKSKSEQSTKNTSKSSKKDPEDKKDVSKSAKTAKSSFKAPAYKDVIEISVSELHWKPTGGLQKFFILNKDNVSRAFKIKCSDNLLYRFSPVYGMIEPNGKFEVTVLRNNGASKIDKLVILTVQAPGDEKCQDRWKEMLAAGEPQAEIAVVALIASTT